MVISVVKSFKHSHSLSLPFAAFYVASFKQLFQIKLLSLSALEYLPNSQLKVSPNICNNWSSVSRPESCHRASKIRLTIQLSEIIQLSVAITVIYLFTVELFPTTMRSTGFSCCNIIARFAMIFLPLVLSASATAIWLPAALMGIISALGAISTMLLPDTKGIDLLEKLEDAEDFYSKHKLCCCWLYNTFSFNCELRK